MDELAGVIKTWPWFGAARMELCERMSKVGGSEWGKEQYADAAMYIASRTIISDLVRAARETDYSDKDVHDLLKKFISPSYQRTVTVPGGDFFSQEEYKDVTLEEDSYFSKFKAVKSDDDDPGNGRIRSSVSAPRHSPGYMPSKATMLRQRRFIPA